MLNFHLSTNCRILPLTKKNKKIMTGARPGEISQTFTIRVNVTINERGKSKVE